MVAIWQTLDMLTEAVQKISGRLQTPSATWPQSIVQAVAAGIYGSMPGFVRYYGRPSLQTLLTSIAGDICVEGFSDEFANSSCLWHMD